MITVKYERPTVLRAPVRWLLERLVGKLIYLTISLARILVKEWPEGSKYVELKRNGGHYQVYFGVRKIDPLL